MLADSLVWDDGKSAEGFIWGEQETTALLLKREHWTLEKTFAFKNWQAMFLLVFGKYGTGEECKGKFWFCNSTPTLKKPNTVYVKLLARMKSTDRTVL